ncbi:MAG: penicillin acylase family protein [Bacteroidota bacterium]
MCKISGIFILLFFSLYMASAQSFSEKEKSRWQSLAQNVTIIRDEWGVSHIYGKTDADAVFGLMYVQCEDDFRQVEYNYICALGRAAEIEGEKKLYEDLWSHIYSDTISIKKLFTQVKPPLKKLMIAFADGMNYYLFMHPEVKPRVLNHYEAWYPLLFSEGSSEGNLDNQSGIRDSLISHFLIDQTATACVPEEKHPFPDGGSNAIAIAPKLSKSGNALLLINPHVDVFYRTEVHIVSDEGLNAYGAVSRGQFFVYHGFNQHCGWAHTTSYADTQDAFEETVLKKGDQSFYKYGKEERRLGTKKICIGVRNKNSVLEQRHFQVNYTHHGPIMAQVNGKYISITPLHEPVKELEQQWTMMKAKNMEDFTKAMNIRSNATNNTMYSDDKGNIAYWHGNSIPKRNPSFDWSKKQKSDPATEWKGKHSLNEIIHLVNPANGWIQNCNSSPYYAAGNNSPDPAKYPFYMATESNDARAVNMIRLLQKDTAFTPEKLRDIAYDNYLSAYEIALPKLFAAYEVSKSMPDSLKIFLAEPVESLLNWDKRSTVNSEATTLAVVWREKVLAKYLKSFPLDSILKPDKDIDTYTRSVFTYVSPGELLKSLSDAVVLLNSIYGTWKVAEGEVFRFQRPAQGTDGFDDQLPSTPLYFQSGRLGSLPAANYTAFGKNKKRYTRGGNSFVAIVEFGPQLKASSIVAGGQSSDPNSKHFSDQAAMYCKGQLKEVHFYKEDVLKHKEKEYHPGE